MDRRRFLTTAALGVTALALSHKNAFATTSTGFSPLISIGFAPALPADGAAFRLTDAASILMPDPGGVPVDAVMSKRFRFWSAADNGPSGNLSFTTQAVATSGIDFIARRMKDTTKKEETSTTAPADIDPAPFTLSLGSAAGPKLQRGVYVVALRESASEIITDWSRFAIAAANGVYTIPGADFAWVILKIDYAK